MVETMIDLETRVEQLEDRLRLIEERLVEIARSGAPGPDTVERAQPRLDTVRQPEVVPVVDSRIDIELVGRSLIGIGGAYLLRALTDSDLLPNLPGLALGLAYALFWVYRADRSASRNNTHAATFSAAVAALIAYPLLCEATIRFHSFSIEFAALILLLISGALLSIAWRRGLGSAAWIATLGSIGATAVLTLETQQIAVPLLAQALTGALLWHISSQRQWTIVRWPGVAATWLTAIALQLVVLGRHDGDSPELTAVALLIVAFAYLGAVAAKNLLIRENVTWADVVQAIGTIAFVLTGAARISSDLPRLMPEVTIAIAIVAAGAYFTAMRQPPDEVRATYYFGGLAVACTLIATAIPTKPVFAGMIWIFLATVSIFAARGFSASQFMAHSMIYAIAGATATGLLGGAFQTISGLGTRPPIALAPAVASAGIALAAVVAIVYRESSSMTWRIARVTLLALAAIVCIAGLDLAALRLTGMDTGSAAAVRSGVIAVSAVTLAFVARLRRFADCSVLVYPVLALGAAKFVIDDFIAGRAATLFVTLAVYGCALLMLARMRRMGPTASTT